MIYTSVCAIVTTHAFHFFVPPSELGKLLFKSNILHITSYFIMDIVYYSYILRKIQCNLLILHKVTQQK